MYTICITIATLDEQFFYPTDTAFSVSLSKEQSYQDETYKNYQPSRTNS